MSQVELPSDARWGAALVQEGPDIGTSLATPSNTILNTSVDKAMLIFKGISSFEKILVEARRVEDSCVAIPP